MADHIEKLQQHFRETEPPYRQETIETIGRWCRVGYMSEQRALAFLELLEADRQDADAEDMDRVFGATVLHATLTGIPRIEVFADEPRYFNVDL